MNGSGAQTPEILAANEKEAVKGRVRRLETSSPVWDAIARVRFCKFDGKGRLLKTSPGRVAGHGSLSSAVQIKCKCFIMGFFFLFLSQHLPPRRITAQSA